MVNEATMMEEPAELPLLKRSRSANSHAEASARPLLTYRPKPPFETYDMCSSSISSANSSTPFSVVACGSKGNSNSSTPPSKASGSSPLLSASQNSSSPSKAWPSLTDFGSASANCNVEEGPIFYPTGAALPSKKPLIQAADEEENQLAVERATSWTQYLDAVAEGHEEAAKDRHMIDMSQLFLGQKFACGSYSRLYRGQYKEREVAVKLVRQPDDDEEVADRLDRQFCQEVSLLSRLHHQNVVEFVGAMRKPPVFCIITEYLPGGSLRALLHKHQPDALPIDTVLAFALDIARGMEYLHSQGVLHLDLKSHNLVLADDSHIKVTDFGVARLQSECESMKPDCGTYRWMAPEMISNKTFSTKADVYSFGIILWEIYTGLTPYEDMSTIQAAFAVVHKNVRPRIPDHCPRPLKQLMEECWSAYPEKRPNFWQIVQRLEEFRGFVCRDMSTSFGTWQFDCEKRNWFVSLLHKFKLICHAGN